MGYIRYSAEICSHVWRQSPKPSEMSFKIVNLHRKYLFKKRRAYQSWQTNWDFTWRLHLLYWEKTQPFQGFLSRTSCIFYNRGLAERPMDPVVKNELVGEKLACWPLKDLGWPMPNYANKAKTQAKKTVLWGKKGCLTKNDGVSKKSLKNRCLWHPICATRIKSRTGRRHGWLWKWGKEKENAELI